MGLLNIPLYIYRQIFEKCHLLNVKQIWTWFKARDQGKKDFAKHQGWLQCWELIQKEGYRWYV